MAPAFHGAGHAPAFHGSTVTGAAWHGGGFHGHPGFAGHGGFSHPRGWGRPGFGFHRPFWGGGYWHGGFWPRAYYGWGFPWFFPVLPAFYATYWWGGVPYYYVNNVYYTWSPDDNGYVATDPPPVAGGSADDEGAPPPASDQADGAASSGNYGEAPPSGSYGNAPPNVNDVYVYPRNGQSEEQQSQDKYECHKWAVSQSGFDPTRGTQASGDPTDYRRALAACLDGRGYSAK